MNKGSFTEGRIHPLALWTDWRHRRYLRLNMRRSRAWVNPFKGQCHVTAPSALTWLCLRLAEGTAKNSAIVTNFGGHFMYIETSWKFWNEAWIDPMELFCYRHTYFLRPYMDLWTWDDTLALQCVIGCATPLYLEILRVSDWSCTMVIIKKLYLETKRITNNLIHSK